MTSFITAFILWNINGWPNKNNEKQQFFLNSINKLKLETFYAYVTHCYETNKANITNGLAKTEPIYFKKV